MDEEKKMRLVVEFDRDEVAATMMLLGEKLTDERWRTVTEAPISMDFEKFGPEGMQLKMALVAIGIIPRITK